MTEDIDWVGPHMVNLHLHDIVSGYAGFVLAALQSVRGEHGSEVQAHQKAVVGRETGGVEVATPHHEEQRRRSTRGVHHAGKCFSVYSCVLAQGVHMQVLFYKFCATCCTCMTVPTYPSDERIRVGRVLLVPESTSPAPFEARHTAPYCTELIPSPLLPPFQLIIFYKEVFEREGLDLWLKPYSILSTAKTTGLIEVCRRISPEWWWKRRRRFDAVLSGPSERRRSVPQFSCGVLDTILVPDAMR